MKSAVVAMLVLCGVLNACGQSAPKPAIKDDGSFMGWVHSAWEKVQREGRPAAEKVVRQWPKRFQDVKSTCTELNKRARTTIDRMDLEQKKNMLVEIWRVRKSLDLMTLLKPEVLQSLTGMDTSGLKTLEDQATSLCDFVTQKVHSH
ncbi:MAG: hypothetical protein P4L46_12620 [Fimbriimonas sp.]|nr:hypothetical protein [Fimbriimonas sp.]